MCADTMHFDPAVYVDVAGYRDVCEVGGVQEAVISAFSMPHLYPFHLCVEQLDLALPVSVSSRFIVCVAFCCMFWGRFNEDESTFTGVFSSRRVSFSRQTRQLRLNRQNRAKEGKFCRKTAPSLAFD